ncbi:MAG: c-type cytochrome [Anaerolineae bacterium]|nr:c-type cytochrome [Anaerolineae bacterium]MDW8098837.1 c-type cytochrome [Anaerolineae bacterium]
MSLFRYLMKWAILAFSALALLILALVIPIAASPTGQEAPPELPSARRGRVIYQQNCAPCHGDRGLGNGPAASGLSFPPTQFADAAIARQASLADWFHVTKNGRIERMMPPWSSRLSDQEIWDAVAFAWTLHLEPGEIDQGRQIYQSQCAICHGDQGKGDGPQAPPNTPDLTAPEQAFGRSLAQWFEVLTRGRGDMPSFERTLTEEQRWAVLEYARAFAYQPLAAPVFEPGQGTISGVVTNGTSGGGSTAGITVTLRVFDSATFEEIRFFQTTTAADGSFRFEKLPTSSDWAYLATLDYAGVPYASALQSFPTDTIEMDFPIEVYEPTEDPTGIHIERAHWFVDFDLQSQNLLIGEFYIIGKGGDRVYVGGELVTPNRRITLRFPLPPGYQDLAVEGETLGQRFFEVNGNLVDTLPLPPGQAVRQVLLRYRYPYRSSQLDFVHTLAYPTANLNVLVSDIGVEVSSRQVTLRDRQGGADQQFLNLVRTDVPAGEKITLSFKGLPVSVQGGSPTAGVMRTPLGPTAIIGFVAVVLGALVAVATYPIWRRRLRIAPSIAGAHSSTSDLEAERQRLLRVIARLDDDYAAGLIAEDVYQQRRARHKARLIEIMRQMQQEQQGPK